MSALRLRAGGRRRFCFEPRSSPAPNRPDEKACGGRRPATHQRSDRDNRARPGSHRAAWCPGPALTHKRAAERHPESVEAPFRFGGSSLRPALPR